MDAFLEGFLEFVPKELVSVFDERELEVRVAYAVVNWRNVRD
jgi:hypothetical protein